MAMTDCNAIALDALTLSAPSTAAAASSWCAAVAVPPSGRIRVLRLIRPHHHLRRHLHSHHHHPHHHHPQQAHQGHLLVAPPDLAAPSYGFAVRGGREFGAGFFVTHVERGSEADMKGMRVGDQIVRANGFRVDDAVHKEFVQFVAAQDRLTLNVRGVGLLPVKDSAAERLTWQVVGGIGGNATPSERSYASSTATMTSADSRATSTVSGSSRSTTIERQMPPAGVEGAAAAAASSGRHSKEMRVRLLVAPRTKLGLGICKGPDWKPGIFVQFTKDQSVARDAGLRQGDQILSVNAIDFADVLFSEAVAVMKGATQLDMCVRTAAGCDLFPGESSGYNSSASSVTGDQSPCWADAKSKRLTAVREEREGGGGQALKVAAMTSSPSVGVGVGVVVTPPLAATPNLAGPRQELNKTIIKLSENGTSINNTFIANTPPLATPPMTVMYEGHSQTTRPQQHAHHATQVPPPPPPQASDEQRQPPAEAFSASPSAAATTPPLKRIVADVHRPLASATAHMPRPLGIQRSASRSQERSGKSPPHAGKSISFSGAHAQFGGGARGQQQQRQATAAQQHYSNTAVNNNNTANTGNNNNNNGAPISSTSLSSAITEELKKRREKQRNNAGRAVGGDADPKAAAATTTTPTTTTTMLMTTTTTCPTPPAAQAPAFAPNNGAHKLRSAPPPTTTTTTPNDQQQQQQQQQQSTTRVRRTTTSVGAGAGGGSGAAAAGERHSALMDEFMSFHQRMFKNGFHESEQERQEALNRTSIMEDDVSHRKCAAAADAQPGRAAAELNNVTQAENEFNIPPPPPQFANNGHTKAPANSHGGPANGQQRQQNGTQAVNSKSTLLASRHIYQAPISPVPDYDNVRLRPASQAIAYRPNTNNNNGTTPTTTTTTTMNGPTAGSRISAVTIGQYRPEQQRKEPAKLDFIGQGQRRRNSQSGQQQQQQQQQQPSQQQSNYSNLQQSYQPLGGAPRKVLNAKSMENLQSELESTLTRSNLKKKALNQSQEHLLQHKYDCPLQNYGQYENYQITGGSATTTTTAATTNGNAKAQMNGGFRPTNGNTGTGGTGTGILKNGNGRSSAVGPGGHNGLYGKNIEKSIKFGN